MGAESQEYVLSGTIVTVSGPDATAVRVRGGQFVEVGYDDVVDRARADGVPVRVVDNAVVIPGIVDPHVHLEHLALGLIDRVDCTFPSCQTIDEIVARLRERSGAGPVRGFTNLFVDRMLVDQQLPTRVDLDRVSVTEPVILNCGGHVSVLNSRALEALPTHVLAGEADGLWGAPVIRRDERGEPTGVVAEIDGYLPHSSFSPEVEDAALIEALIDRLVRHGVTTVGEMVETREAKARLERLAQARGLPARIVGYVLWPAVGELHEVLEMLSDSGGSVAPSTRFHLGGMKVFADGGFSSRNAATFARYTSAAGDHGELRGRMNLSYERVKELLRAARDREVRLAIHANGSRTQAEVLRAVIDEGSADAHLPVRIEHLGNLREPELDLDLVIRAKVIPVVQPGFLWSFIGDFVPEVVDLDPQTGLMPLRSFLDRGIDVAFSSDFGLGSPPRESNPWVTMDTAVRRVGFRGHAVQPEQAVTFDEALRMHTLVAARAIGMSDQIGSIEVGKRADFVVVDHDPRRPDIDIGHVVVREVRIDGELAYLAP